MSAIKRRSLAILSGLLLWLSFPNFLALNFQPWTGWLAWLALIPLCVALWGRSVPLAFRTGLLSGFVFYLLSLTWITNVKPMGPASLPACGALALWCALFTGAWGAGVAWVAQRKAALPVIALAALWALLELLRERLFTGFPWVNLGSSQALNPAILPLAAITGQVGLHFAVALGNLIFFALLFEQKLLLGRARSLSATLVLGLLFWGAHAARWQTAPAPGGPSVKVGIIQGNIDQDQVWTKTYRDQIMSTYLLMSQAAIKEGAQVLVWPESSFPGFFNLDAVEARQIKAFAKEHKVYFLMGSTLVEGPDPEHARYRNAALSIGPDGTTQSQGKRHMVPFGEYVPFRRAIPVLDAAMQRLGVTDFVPGQAGPLFDLAGLKTQPLICYESVFPAVPRQGPDPDLLGVITVDTWYGRSAGPVWHATQCALRAVENGCWVARSAATGISLFVDPQGHLLKTIGLEQSGYAVAEIFPGKGSFYRRHGEWLAALLLLLLGVVWGKSFFQKDLTNVQNH